MVQRATKRDDLIPSARNVVVVEADNIESFRQDPNVEYVEEVPVYEPFPVEENVEESRESINLQNAINEFGNGDYYPLFTNNECVDYYHPDLIDKVDFEVPLYLNPNGWNVNTFLTGYYNHGTHTAGTVLGHSLDIGTPNARLAFGAKTSFYMTELLEYLVENNIRVLTESYGSTTYSQTEANARLNAYNNGLIMIAAAGNDDSELGVQRNQYPCMYDGVLCVGCNCGESNYSSEYVHISAPYSDTSTIGGPTLLEMLNDYNDGSTYWSANCEGYCGLTWICDSSYGMECDGCASYYTGVPQSGNSYSVGESYSECSSTQTTSGMGYGTYGVKLENIWKIGLTNAGGVSGGGDSWVHPVTGETVIDPWYTHRGIGGTSMSTPQVSSVALLLLSHNPDLTPDQIREILITTGNTNVSYVDVQGPKVNAYQALSYMYDNYMTLPPLGPGDINEDGVINVSDIMMVVNHILDGPQLTEAQQLLADMDQNGQINIADIVMIVQQILGITPQQQSAIMNQVRRLLRPGTQQTPIRNRNTQTKISPSGVRYKITRG